MGDTVERGRTTTDRLKYWAEKQPHAEAFVFVSKSKPRCSFTSKEIYDLSREFGGRLSQLGLRPGSTICSLIPDSPETLVAFFGIHFAGCIVQNGTVILSDGSFLLENLKIAKCSAVVLSHESRDMSRQIITKHFDVVSGNHVSSSKLPHLKHVIYTRPTSGNEKIGFVWENETEINYEDILVDDNAHAVIVISSGTTGFSKMISLSHSGVMSYCNLFGAETGPIKPNDSIFNNRSLSWAGGLPSWYMQTGKKRVLLDKRYVVADEVEYYRFILDTIILENCTNAVFIIPIFFRLYESYKELASKCNWPLKKALVLGQPIRDNVLQLIGPFTATIHNAYGCSETGPLSFKVITKGSQFTDFNAGHPRFGSQVKIVDTKMRSLPSGEYGQILAKSNGMFPGYVGNLELTRSSFTEDGFFCTNDYGCLTTEGEIIVQGRYNDVIMRGDNYFHPSWIESIIRQCANVADVVVVKVPDPIVHHEICACILPEKGSKLTEKTVEEFCSLKFITSMNNTKSACPKYYIILNAIPLNANGKEDRKAIEQIAAKHLNLNI